MTAQLIEATIRHLYEGQHVRRGAPLSDQVEFRDPLVVVRGERSVAAMFRKLNALFPVTTIERFEAEEDGVLRFSMSVHYRRAEGAKAKVFESTLEVEAVDGAI